MRRRASAVAGRVCLIATLASVLAGIAACQRSGDPAGASSNEEGTTVALGTAPLVQDYLKMADAAGAETTEVDAAFVADALRKLAAALGAQNLADLDVQVALRVAAEHVLSSPDAPGTTAAVRNSLVSATDAIQRGRGGDAAMRQAAESLHPDRPLLGQSAALRQFFRASGPAIRDVSGA